MPATAARSWFLVSSRLHLARRSQRLLNLPPFRPPNSKLAPKESRGSLGMGRSTGGREGKSWMPERAILPRLQLLVRPKSQQTRRAGVESIVWMHAGLSPARTFRPRRIGGLAVDRRSLRLDHLSVHTRAINCLGAPIDPRGRIADAWCQRADKGEIGK